MLDVPVARLEGAVWCADLVLGMLRRFFRLYKASRLTNPIGFISGLYLARIEQRCGEGCGHSRQAGARALGEVLLLCAGADKLALFD